MGRKEKEMSDDIDLKLNAVLLDIAIDVQSELLRQCKQYHCDDWQTDNINSNTISVFELNNRSYIQRLKQLLTPPASNDGE